MALIRPVELTTPGWADVSKSKAVAVGLGGAGNDLLTHLMGLGLGDLHCVAVDTDRHALEITNAHQKLLIQDSTKTVNFQEADGVRNLGVRMSRELQPILSGNDLVFILAGMGGTTGGGTAPLIAEIARRNGALVIGVVTRPFGFERDRFQGAVDSVRKMITACDTVVLLDNHAPDPSSMTLPFQLSIDPTAQTCYAVIHTLTGTFKQSNLCNGELGELRTMLRRGGLARANIGHSNSHLGAEEAAMKVLRDTTADEDLAKANGAFVNVIGGEHVQRTHVESAVSILSRNLAPSAQFLYGHRVDQRMRSLTSVTLLTMGISFPESWRRYRRIPLELYDLEAESGDEEDLRLELGLQQLETQVTQANL